MPKQDVRVEIFYDGAWQDITAADDVFTAPVTITRGQGDESPAPRPASATAQLANDDDRYRTSNPLSPLYGKAGRNAPVRVSVADVVRYAGEASSLKVDQTQDFRRTPRRGRAWADLDSGGLLRRINQWTEPLRSPFYTYNADLTTLVGYWSMEDPRGAVLASTPVEGAANTRLLGVSFDSQKRPPGSGPVADVVLQDASTFKFAPGSVSSTGGWQYSVVVNMASLGGSFYTPVNVQMLDGSGVSFSLNDATGESVLLAYDSTLSTRFTSTNAWPSGFEWSGRWIVLGLKATYSGGTTTVNAYFRALDEDTWYNPSGTYSGVTSELDASFCSGLPDASSFGHVTGTVGTSEDLTSEDRITALRGHAGETAADRFARLCTLKGIGYSIIGTAADSYPMGPQGVDTFPKQLEEILGTEDGLIFDAVDAAELVLMLRNARYRQTAITLNAADLIGLPAEVTDDLGTHNVVTVTQRDGGDYTAQDDTGPLGTLPPPDGVGEARQQLGVNAYDVSTLPQLASWWLGRGTVDLPRFPTVALNLAALDPATIAVVEGIDIGSVIEIPDIREYVVRLYVLGYTEVIGPTSRRITFTCAPDQQFVVGEWDASDSRWDARTSTVRAAMSPSAASLPVGSTDSTLWDTAGVPYDVLVAGERMTVTAVGDFAADTFTRSTSAGSWGTADTGQTWTVSGAGAEVNGTTGTHNLTAAGVRNTCTLPLAATVTEVRLERIQVPAAVTGSGGFVTLSVKIGTSTSYVTLNVQLNTGGTASHWLSQLVGGVETVFDSLFPATGVTATSTMSALIRIVGLEAKAKIWAQGGAEPDWTTSITLTAPNAAGDIVLESTRNASTTNGNPFYVEWDGLTTPTAQSLTVTRGVNGLVKPHDIGEEVHVATPGRWA